MAGVVDAGRAQNGKHRARGALNMERRGMKRRAPVFRRRRSIDTPLGAARAGRRAQGAQCIAAAPNG
jgi:hypothetical protein